MKRLMKYLKGKSHMKLTLLVNSVSVIRWWVYASYNSHYSCKGHTGVIISLVKRDLLSKSMKQKFSVPSSTES